MLTRLHVRNYRCLADFDFRPQQVQLLLGGNGCGKTTILDALDALRRIAVEGEPLEGLVGGDSVTVWNQLFGRAWFAVEFDDRFAYELQVGHSLAPPHIRVDSEKVSIDNRIVFHTEMGILQSDGTSAVPTQEFRTDRSAFASSIPSFEVWSTVLQLKTLIAAEIHPWGMRSRSEKPAQRPDRNMANLADWFRHLAQEDPPAVSAAIAKLRDAMPHLESLSAKAAGLDVRVLQAQFSHPQATFSLDQLSEGQRSLIALHLLVSSLKRNSILLLDEPDNFIGLSEIQPWLLWAIEHAGEIGAQLIIASHHPELLNQLARNALVLERDASGGTRAMPFPTDRAGLSPAEVVTRGWESA